MPILVDGHNLVPHVPGLSLRDPDDELQLIRLLEAHAARTRKSIAVYFDRAAPGIHRPASRSRVSVRFVSAPATADQAIGRHLTRLGKDARNWTVVSSDAEVRRQALAAGARWLSSPEFARQIVAGGPAASGSEKPDPPKGPDELREWASLFSLRSSKRPRKPH